MLYSEPMAAEVDSPPHSPRPDRRQPYLFLALAMLAALGIGSGLRLLSHSSLFEGQSSPEPTETTTGTADFPQPFHAAAPTLRLASPGLLPSTPSQARLQTLAAGRSDPFASVLTPSSPGPLAVVPISPASSLPSVPPPPQPAADSAVISVVGSELPLLPAVPQSATPAKSRVGAAPQARAAIPSPSSSALDQIAVTGVVKIGNQVSVIITEPGSPGGRRVTVGETLAGGQVRLQRVDLSAGEPLVVLRHRGNDYYRTVGLGTTL